MSIRTRGCRSRPPSRAGDVALLYSSHDTEHGNAVLRRDYVNERLEQRMDAASSHSGRGRGR